MDITIISVLPPHPFTYTFIKEMYIHASTGSLNPPVAAVKTACMDLKLSQDTDVLDQHH